MLPDFLQETAGTRLDNRLTGGFIPSRATLVLVPTNLHKQWLSLDQKQESIVRLGPFGVWAKVIGSSLWILYLWLSLETLNQEVQAVTGDVYTEGCLFSVRGVGPVLLFIYC